MKTRSVGTSLSSTCPEALRERSRTSVIAHRGASAYLPEHTLAAKALAYGLGADFIEQDLVATKDRELVVLHDLVLDDVSDAAAVFPERRRADGCFYVVDFTLAELGRLTLHERRRRGEAAPAYPGRFPFALEVFKIVRFDDECRLIAGLNRATGRSVGLYPEIKEPAWHARAGIDLVSLTLAALERASELGAGPIFLQCFDSATLMHIHESAPGRWPLVQLLDRDGAARLARSPGAIELVARYAAGVGLPYPALLEPADDELGAKPTRLALELKAAGLLIHPYTLRRDASPPDAVPYQTALRVLIHELEVDAVFCDFPDDAVSVRDCSAA